MARGVRLIRELLHHWFLPQRSTPLAITGSEVLGVVPLEVADALLDEFHHLAGRHERASWSSRSWSCSPPADPGRGTMSAAVERS